MGEKDFEHLEARIIRLEENFWFQERRQEGLEAALKELDSQFVRLEKEVEFLKKHLLEIHNEVFSLNLPRTPESPPPHWQQEK